MPRRPEMNVGISRVTCRLAVLVTFLWLPLASLAGQKTSPVSDTAADSTRVSAPVVLGGDTLFSLHARFGAFTARERADAVTQRLAILVGAIGSGADSVAVTNTNDRTELVVGHQVLMTVLDDDALERRAGRLDVATQYARIITDHAKAYVASHTLKAYLRGAVYAAIVVAALVAILFGMSWLFRGLYDRLTHESFPIPSLRIQRLELLSAKSIATMLTAVARLIRTLLTLLLVYAALSLVLSFFPSTAGYATTIVGYAIAPVGEALHAFVTYLPDAFSIVVIVVIARYLIKLLHSIFIALGNGTITVQGFYRDWAMPTYKLVRTLVIVFAAVVIFPHLPGSSSDAFKGISVFLGILVSLGSSGAVSNMVAGVVLTYTRAFQVGDRVRIGDTVGDVTQRTLLVTRVLTIKNVEVTIPNGSVLSSHAHNYSRMADGDGVILHTTVTIGYDVPWRQVHELLLAAAAATVDARKSPAPFVLQTSLDDFYVSYELNLYTGNPAGMARIYAEIHQNIQDAFNKAKVEIMSPHYGARRDGNHTTVPEMYLPDSYRAPAFRVEQSTVKPD